MHAGCTIQVGDLVRGTSIHNYGLIGVVVNYDPNRSDEFRVHWMVEDVYTPNAFYSMYERSFDMEKVS
jgi:hypothetical protein